MIPYSFFFRLGKMNLNISLCALFVYLTHTEEIGKRIKRGKPISAREKKCEAIVSCIQHVN